MPGPIRFTLLGIFTDEEILSVKEEKRSSWMVFADQNTDEKEAEQ